MSRTDDRARCHRQRDELALRMMRHGARSSIVSAWTGLSTTRIRTLAQQNMFVPQLRHRGQPPQRVTYFFRAPLITIHAATLGSLFDLFEVLPNRALGTPAPDFRTLGSGEKLCHAYEMYVAMVESPLIRFEHAVLLATALAEGKEIFLMPCPQCEGALLVDRSALATDACTHCRSSARLPAISGRPADTLLPERPTGQVND